MGPERPAVYNFSIGGLDYKLKEITAGYGKLSLEMDLSVVTRFYGVIHGCRGIGYRATKCNWELSADRMSCAVPNGFVIADAGYRNWEIES